MALKPIFRCSLALLAVGSISAEMYGPDGEALRPDSDECASCAFAAIHAKKTYDKGEKENSFTSVNDWINILEEGCHGDQACPALIRKYGKAMGGALVDFVQDGDDAEEKNMDVSEFQGAICHKYAEVCKTPYGFPSVKSVTFSVPRESNVDVGIFKRGSSQSGDQPLKPSAVVAPGKHHTFTPSQSLSLRTGYAFRLSPIEDISCPNEASLSTDPNKCLISCGSSSQHKGGSQSGSCRQAEKVCHRLKPTCSTLSLDSNGNAYLKSINISWNSPMLLDIFLTDEFHQEYIVTSHPDFDPTLPEKIPNAKLQRPESWDEEEDGTWEPPLVANTDNLRNNPRFLASLNGAPAGQIAHKGGLLLPQQKKEQQTKKKKKKSHNINNEEDSDEDEDAPAPAPISYSNDEKSNQIKKAKKKSKKKGHNHKKTVENDEL